MKDKKIKSDSKEKKENVLALLTLPKHIHKMLWLESINNDLGFQEYCVQKLSVPMSTPNTLNDQSVSTAQ